MGDVNIYNDDDEKAEEDDDDDDKNNCSNKSPIHHIVCSELSVIVLGNSNIAIAISNPFDTSIHLCALSCNHQ
jgi:hypothetical protein